MDVKTLMCIIMAILSVVSIIVAVCMYNEKEWLRDGAKCLLDKERMTYCVNCKHHLKMTRRIGDKDTDTVVCKFNALCARFEEKEAPSAEEQAAEEYLKARAEAWKKIEKSIDERSGT